MLSGFSMGHNVGAHANNYHNSIVALQRRLMFVERNGVLCKPPSPLKGIFGKMVLFKEKFLSNVPQLEVCSMEDLLPLYKGRRKADYIKAYLEYQSVGYLRKHARVNTFLKVEKKILNHKKDVPRLIQPRSKVYNLCLGKYLRKNEHKLLQHIDTTFGYRVVMSGFNNAETAGYLRMLWNKLTCPVAIGVDASRFDQHCSVSALQYEHSFYNSIFRSEELAKLLEHQLDNSGRMFTDDGFCINYRHKGGRMSGDINTSLGNKLLMCGMMYEMIHQFNLENMCYLANNGDDCVLFCESHVVERVQNGLPRWFLNRGYTMEVEPPAKEFENLEFCRSKPVMTKHGWKMVRILDSISRDASSMRNLNGAKAMDEFLCAIGVCNGIINDGVPILSVMAKRMRELSRLEKIQNMREHFDENMLMRIGKQTRMDSEITERARISFYKAFGVHPEQQINIEEYYLQATNDGEPVEVKNFSQPYSYLTPSHFFLP